MRSIVKYLGQLPPYPTEDLTHTAQIINGLTLVSVPGPVFYILILVASNADHLLARVIANLCLLGMLAIALYAVRVGQVRWAALLLPTAMWIMIVVVSLRVNRIISITYPTLIVSILLARLFLGRRAGYSFAVLSCGVGLLDVIGNGATSTTTTPPYTALQVWTSQSFVFILAVLLLSVVMNRLQTTIERWRSLIENTSDFIAELDLHYTILFTNRDPMAADANTSVAGLNLLDFATSASRPPMEQALRQAILTKKPMTIEVERHAESEPERWFQVRISPIVRDGMVTRLSLISNEITERRRLEAEAREAERMRGALETQQELNEFRNRFLSKASHEFRTPLGIIQNNIFLLQEYYEGLSADERLKYFAQVERQIKYLDQMVENILLLTRSQAVQIECLPTEVEVEPFCRQVLDSFDRPDQKYHFEMATTLQSATFDPILLRTILTNLLSNAVKYSPDGGTIRLEANKIGDKLEFRVSDKGIGIPPEALKNLFLPFYRADNTGTVKGAGLGLAIAQEYVKAHNGDIHCESEVGQGTTFIVTLPAL